MKSRWGLYAQGVALLVVLLLFFGLYAWATTPTR